MNYLVDFWSGCSEQTKFAIGTWFFPTFVFWSINGVLAMIYHYDLFSKYKIQRDKWVDNKLLRAAVIDLSINHFLIRPVTAYYVYDLHKYFGMPSIDSPLPSFFNILCQIVIFMVVTDALFYWTHRLFHHRLIYKHVHKKHHEFKVSYGIAAEYAHPLETTISNIMPTLIAPILMGSHMYVLWFWLVLRETETIEAHCGYNFPYAPWRLLLQLGGPTDRHDFHHSHNVGNYGAFFPFWDWICGTDVSYKSYKQKQINNTSQKTN